jgi:hypothetical protein
MNRRGFLKLLGLAPVLPLAAKVRALAPDAFARVDVKVFEPTYTAPDPDWDKLVDYFAPAGEGLKAKIMQKMWESNPYAQLLDGGSFPPYMPEHDGSNILRAVEYSVPKPMLGMI